MLNNNKSLISIGLPVVKTKYLKLAIESCLNQTYENIEINILNNAADKITGDEIESICLSFCDKRINYYRNEKQIPMIKNWNKVFAYSKGIFFALLCDDDEWDIKFIEEMKILTDEFPGKNIFHCRVLIKNEISGFNKLSPICPKYETCLDFIYHRIKGDRIHFLSDFMISTDALRRLGGFIDLPDGWGSDDITWFKIAQNEGICYCDIPLLIYNNNSESITNSKSLGNKYKSIPLYVKYIKEIVSELTYRYSLDELNQLIIKALIVYQKKYYTALGYTILRGKKYIPNFTIPFLMLFFKGFKFITGWKKVI